MSVTIVIGGQYGGEGKGKVTYCIAKEKDIKITVRVGGTNSGHTVVDDNDNEYILRQLPTTSILKDSISVLSAGSYIDLDILKNKADKMVLKGLRWMPKQLCSCITAGKKIYRIMFLE